LIFILSNCQLKDPIKGHGINFLKNRSEKISLNKSNKNDVIKVLGNPHTKSIDDENLWFYFDRKIASGKLVKFKEMDLLENNVLILNFDKYGIVVKKEFFSKEDMKKIKYSEMKTENPVTQDSFVTSFLQSVRQKMYGKRKF
ncbi:MAG: outer membrane protein assembly factor BamE, partial [Pseudomonadota bacterium]|nr:outer membrane protein assembly factor BamE [Pseudomonadota bacterium]